MKQPELGRKILELRLTSGLTQKELAERCNLSIRTVQRIEAAEVTPRSFTIKSIFSCLNSDSEYLLTDLANDNRNYSYLRGWINKHLDPFLEWCRTNKKIMIKLSITLIIALTATGIILTNNNLKAQQIEGWFIAGSKPNSYEIGLDNSTFKTGGSSAFMVSTKKQIDGFGTLMQMSDADAWLGKRIRMSGYVKSENVTGWAGMWLRVDAKNERKMLSFDNMDDRPIKGSTDWTKYEIVLDVPEESGTLNFGVLLHGTGKIWFDNLSFESVDKHEVKLTRTRASRINEKPSNLDFN